MNQKLKLPLKVKPTLALGAEMKGSIAIAKDNDFYLQSDLGNIFYLENFEKYKNAIDKLIKETKIIPEIIVCDMHPSYNSSKYSLVLAKRFNAKIVKVQHHHAHIASAAIENNILQGIGIACDGTGYGTDTKIWGGEIFDFDLINKNFERIGSLEEQSLLGGDSATIYPKKMLYGIISKFLSDDEIVELNSKLKLYEKNELIVYRKMIKSNYNAIMTTSTGRIFDAAAVLLGVCNFRSYDAEPAIKLEKYANKAEGIFRIEPKIENNERLILSTTELFKQLIEAMKNNISKEELAYSVHLYLAEGLLEIAKKAGKNNIVFSGGVAFNKIISEHLKDKDVKFNKQISPGDDGIAFGQILVCDNY